MRQAYLDGMDLNLLTPLQALLEERHVSKAAARCGLTQSAMSHALERLRDALKDELLVRVASRYERTQRAEVLLVELNEMMPRLERMLFGNTFEPATSERRFRVATTDFACAVHIPVVLAQLKRAAPKVCIEIVPWTDRTVDDIEAARVDVAEISATGVPSLKYEPLFRDDFVCVVSCDHPARNNLSQEQYLAYPHVVFQIQNNRQPLIDDVLAQQGLRRSIGFTTPFTSSAIFACEGTDLICTISARFARRLAPIANVLVLPAPYAFPALNYVMAWHERLDIDPAQRWFRSIFRNTAAALD